MTDPRQETPEEKLTEGHGNRPQQDKPLKPTVTDPKTGGPSVETTTVQP